MAQSINSQVSDHSSQVFHIVCFQFCESTTPESTARIIERFRQLEQSIPVVRSLKYGLNHSPEGLNKNCTHGFILTFGNESDRDQYLAHPDHEAFVQFVKPHIQDVFVFDFSA
ncbi:MAG: Dabb family protein [Verrucomicrobia bacterium]|nr:Dabb family protein [Verrucomicrobiota bacterium]